MTKLTKAQEAVLNEAKANIDFARSVNFYDWYRVSYNANQKSDEDIEKQINKPLYKDIGGRAYFEGIYKNEIKGITLVMCNTRTLKALENLGYIRIINEGGSYPDRIEVIGY